MIISLARFNVKEVKLKRLEAGILKLCATWRPQKQ